ncbi:acyltransferase [Sphingomonas naphthae]|uniref:Acyltransferase n=1 Tax=Sphingomonas naphthae TaxID=1813468 RepID=A0ABY7TGA7_9SPHN|nr:acyltransferase [Sphingomonas naphthae]WCT71861.1 acyltransferase [Sphingomonas naphthae]
MSAAPISATEAPNGAAARDFTSPAIRIARVMCITGIVYVHAWTGLAGGDIAAANNSAQGALRWGLIELLGRSAVPLLGMISGWLVAGSVLRRGYGSFIGGKARTILAPMVVWNAIAILLVGGAGTLGILMAPTISSAHWVFDELFCLWTPDDINVQMSFLRDLFVCMAMAPLIARLPRAALVAIAVLAAAWSISGFSFLLLLRPQILLFFTIGMLARRSDAPQRLASAPLLALALPYVLLAAAKIGLEISGYADMAEHRLPMATLDQIFRLTTALFFWSIAWRVAQSRLSAPILKIEPFAFLMFCAHLILIWFGGPFVGNVTGRMGSPLYPAFLLLQPVLVWIAAIGIGKALMAVSPAAAKLLSGGRLTAEPRRYRLPRLRPSPAAS